jgi:hypothetical protein
MTFGGPLPLAAALSDRAIGVSSLSKADGLPGIRIGWLTTRDRALRDRFLAAKEQILITNSVVDEAIAEVALARRPERMPSIHAGIQARLAMVRAWFDGHELFEWVEPRGGVVGFPRFRADVPVDLDRFYRILFEGYGTVVGPGHWFDQSRRHFRLGYGWPTTVDLEQGLAALTAAAVEASDAPRRAGARRRGAAVGNILVELERQIFRDQPRVEEIVRSGGEAVGLSGDGDLVVRLPLVDPAGDGRPEPTEDPRGRSAPDVD